MDHLLPSTQDQEIETAFGASVFVVPSNGITQRTARRPRVACRLRPAPDKDLAEATRRGIVLEGALNVLTLASLDVEGSPETAEEAAALLLGNESALE